MNWVENAATDICTKHTLSLIKCNNEKYAVLLLFWGNVMEHNYDYNNRTTSSVMTVLDCCGLGCVINIILSMITEQKYFLIFSKTKIIVLLHYLHNTMSQLDFENMLLAHLDQNHRLRGRSSGKFSTSWGSWAACSIIWWGSLELPVPLHTCSHTKSKSL